MKIFQGFSIRRKLILVQLVTTFTVLLFFSIYHYVRVSHTYLNLIRSELASITELTGLSCVSALHFMDREAAENILHSLESEQKVVNAWIHNTDGGIFAEYAKDGFENYHFNRPLDSLLIEKKHFMFISKSIAYEDEIIGYISIRYHMDDYNDLMKKNRGAAVLLFLAGMGAAWLLAFVTQITISNPLLNLMKTVKHISETGDYSIRPVKERDDDIGHLADGICDMLEQIQLRDYERTQADKALHESEEKYRNLVERANDGIIILQDGLFKYANPSLIRMAKCSEETLLNSPFIHFIEDAEVDKVISNYEKRIYGENINTMYETRFKTNQGEIIDAEVNAGLITYEGKPADLVIIRDITERKQIEKELKKHQEQLEEMVAERTAELEVANERLMELDRMKSMFLASMSHELRTPLNSIIGFTGILLMEMAGTLNPEQKKQLEMVKSSSSHLLELINDILDISKIESGKVNLSIETFDLMDVIRDVLKSVGPLAERKGLHVKSGGISSIHITSDQRRVKQILMNLVGNSVKFTDQGFVKVNVALQEKDRIVVYVSDSGIGIKEEELRKLFQPFQQMDMTSTKKYEGTGLGLYLTKKIISHLQGDIRVSSEYGKGSTFTFVLPLNWTGEINHEEDPDC